MVVVVVDGNIADVAVVGNYTEYAVHTHTNAHTHTQM